MIHETLPTPEDRRHDDVAVTVDARFLARLARRRSGLLLAALVIGLGIAAAYLYSASPVYVSSAKLLIESQRGLGDLPYSGTGAAVDGAQVESQVEILRAAIIAEAVVRKLDLVSDPEFAPPRSATSPWQVLLTFLGAATEPGPDLEPASRPNPAEPRPRPTDEVFNTAVASFGERISVRRLGQSDVIEIDFAASTPAKAERVASEIVETYLSGTWRAAASPGAFRRFNDDVLRKSLAVTNARVISAPQSPLGKSSPRTSLVLAFAAVVSLFAGLALAVWLESRQPAARVRAREADEAGAVAPLRERVRVEKAGYSLTDLQP
jgi:uncharacterized protein involved in exopolysaccharide biosynthesis